MMLAKSPARIVTAAPANGSIAALDRWNSTTQAANTSSRRSSTSARRPASAPPFAVVWPRACGPRPIIPSVASAGRHRIAVSQNTDRLDRYEPLAPITAAAMPLPMEA